MDLNFKTYGDGYPLIILHGLFGSSENWLTISRQFSRCYRVFALDARNHGDSPHSDVMSYDSMADDLREFMDAQRLSSAYVLGHSMGGKTAMQLALTSPEKVDKLVVVDIAPKAYPSQHDAILAALLSLDLGGHQKRKEVDAALASKLPDESLRQFLLKNLTRDESGVLKWKIDLRSISKNYEEILKAVPSNRRFDKPTLFIRSERSGYITPEDSGPIKALFPYSKIVTMPGVGHWIHVEARRQFARLVLAFLGSM